MCLISIAPEGTDKYSKEFIDALRHGASCNRDGSGYSILRKDAKEVTFNKGFFDIAKLLQAIENEKLTKNDILVVHHRIGTHGLKTKENCHPYCLDDPSKISGTTTNGVVSHNGVLSVFTNMREFGSEGPMDVKTSEFSDSYMFVKYFISVPEISSFWKRDPIYFKQLFKSFLEGNRVAFLTPEGLFLSGDFVKQEGGYLHSHGGYCSYRTFHFSDDFDAQRKDSIRTFNSKAPERIMQRLQTNYNTSTFHKKVTSYYKSHLTRLITFLYLDSVYKDVSVCSNVYLANPTFSYIESIPKDEDKIIVLSHGELGKETTYAKTIKEFADMDFVFLSNLESEFEDFLELLGHFAGKELKPAAKEKLSRIYTKCLNNPHELVSIEGLQVKIYAQAFRWFYEIYVFPKKHISQKRLSVYKNNFPAVLSPDGFLTLDSVKRIKEHSIRV